MPLPDSSISKKMGTTFLLGQLTPLCKGLGTLLLAFMEWGGRMEDQLCAQSHWNHGEWIGSEGTAIYSINI